MEPQQITDLINDAWRARREGRHQDAERGLLDAISASRRMSARRELLHALEALAHVLRDVGQNDRALPLYIEAVALGRAGQDPLALAHTVRHLGELHASMGRLSEAGECYVEALSLYRGAASPPPLDFANALRPAALLKEREGDSGAARRLWEEARAWYHAARVDAGVEECTRHLAEGEERLPIDCE